MIWNVWVDGSTLGKSMIDVLGLSWNCYRVVAGLKGRGWRRIWIIEWMVREIRICRSAHCGTGCAVTKGYNWMEFWDGGIW
jgi:hypothetical protein